MGRALCDTFPGTWTHAHSRADTCPGLTLISNCSSNICHSASAKYRVGQRDTSKRKDKRVSCSLSKCTLIYEFSTTNWAKFTTHLQSIHLQKINLQLEIILYSLYSLPFPPSICFSVLGTYQNPLSPWQLLFLLYYKRGKFQPVEGYREGKGARVWWW